ncbi:MAG: formyltransferase family protein [Candidatus Sulfotelmatobacter sp.]
MRVFCLCNNWLGWQILKWLREQGVEIVGLAVHPEARAKYGRQIRQEVANTNCLIIEAPFNDDAVVDQVRKLEPDLAVSILFSYILQPPFLQLFPRGCINLHPAFLPYNRGSYPNVWSIVSGTPAGVTLHYIDEGIDTGDVIAQKEVAVSATDTGATLYHKLEIEALEIFRSTWPSILTGSNSRIPQFAGAGSYHRARDVEQIDEIDLQKSYRAEDLLNLIRARTFAPYSGAYFIQEGRKIYLRLELYEEEVKTS